MLDFGTAARRSDFYGIRLKARTLASVSAIAVVAAAMSVQEVHAQATAAAQGPAEEIIVTGTRVVRDGYSAPTPVTVVGIEQLERAAEPNIYETINTLPAFSAVNNSDRSGGATVSQGRQGLNTLSLRGLGNTRTLTLLDGHRIVSPDPDGTVDTNNIPQNLISRVDVVTGGASAAYGSDALAGVANFIIDKNFVGVKAEAGGGVTTYGDDVTFQVSGAFGARFANDRAHILISTEYDHNPGVQGTPRPWNIPYKIISNPSYATGNGQPQFIVRNQVASYLATPGGIIASGPLKGTAFGPTGTPFQYRFGNTTNTQYTVGGDWALSDITQYNQQLINRNVRQSTFVRASYDITDNVNAYAQLIVSETSAYALAVTNDFQGNRAIFSGNPFIPASVQAAMTANGITSISMGRWNSDLGHQASANKRRLWSYAGGLTGSFDVMESSWNWDLYVQHGFAKSTINGYVLNNVNIPLALDAVLNPANGQIVCRSTLANPTNGCVPFNVFGTDVNSQAAVDYLSGNPRLFSTRTQDVYEASVSGEPFSTWAGPVSTALGFEHRVEKSNGVSDALSMVNAYNGGNYKPTIGRYSVSEGFLEVVAPLASDADWAKSLDINGAVRYTHYSNSGNVTTWKIGATYQPVDDLRFRVTRSRDIRAPNLGDLFLGGTTAQNSNLLDPFNGDIRLGTINTIASGNPLLKPEKANTLALGAVYQASFLPGFSASVDLYDIKVKGAIAGVGAQNILNFCAAGQSEYCQYIDRNSAGVITAVRTSSVNLSRQSTRGLDIEASYRTRLDQLISSMSGDLSLRALGTHTFFRRSDDGINPVTDDAGVNSGATPSWRWLFSASYSLDPISIGWTGRFISSGRYASTYLECASACPTSTIDARTIDYNHIGGAFYQDVNITYKFLHAEDSVADAEMYFAVRNVFNVDPEPVANTVYYGLPTNSLLYDTLGRVFRAGLRFRM